MRWLAKAAWIYPGTLPGGMLDHAKRRGIEVIYVDPRSPVAAQAVDQIRLGGLLAGAYFAKDWKPGLSGAAFADWVSAELQRLLPKTGVEAPPAMLDLETTETAWVAEALTRYRSHQPARPTSYTNAPFQGGYVPTALLKKLGLHLYVQVYYGGMEPADAAAAILEQVRQGMPAAAVHPFYAGAAWAADQRDGCYFTLEKLA